MKDRLEGESPEGRKHHLGEMMRAWLRWGQIGKNGFVEFTGFMSD